MRVASAALAVGLVACSSPPVPVATPVVATPATAVRFAWPSPVVLRVHLRESSRETDGNSREGDHVFLVGYRRESADQHRFWVAGFLPGSGPADPLSDAMAEVAASPSFTIDGSLRVGEAHGEAAWIDLMKAAPALTPQLREVVAQPAFLQHVRDEAWSEWDFVVGQWWPFFAEPPPANLTVAEGSDGTWSSTWTRREEAGVAILTLVRSGPLATAPMRQHLIGLVGVADGMKTLAARGSLSLELRTDPDTMIPHSLVEIHELVIDDGARGRLEHRARYDVVATTPLWRPLP